MLHDLIISNRNELISRCRQKSAKRSGTAGNSAIAEHGVPLFLEQLVDSLRLERSHLLRAVGDPGPGPDSTEIRLGAALHGAELLRLGYTIDQVVHEYGDVCQAVTEMAVEQKISIAVDDFRILNGCLDDAIADAVKAYGGQRQSLITEQSINSDNDLISSSIELGLLLDMAIQSFEALQTGKVGLNASTGKAHHMFLVALRTRIENSTSEIRLDSAKRLIG